MALHVPVISIIIMTGEPTHTTSEMAYCLNNEVSIVSYVQCMFNPLHSSMNQELFKKAPLQSK